MSPMQRHAILQSGFIAMRETDLTKTQMEKDPFVDFTLNKDHLKNRNDFFYSQEITTLYRRAFRNADLIYKFDFREEVLTFAFGQFPKNYFFDWIELQYKSENISQLHAVFLTETIEFALFNQPRKIQAVQWVRMLENNMASKATLVQFKEYFKNRPVESFKSPYEHNSKTLENVQTLDLIKAWSSTPDRFVDMLLSLHTIFGSRYDIVDVANNIRGY
jgi:hypothetical protein